MFHVLPRRGPLRRLLSLAAGLVVLAAAGGIVAHWGGRHAASDTPPAPPSAAWPVGTDLTVAAGQGGAATLSLLPLDWSTITPAPATDRSVQPADASALARLTDPVEFARQLTVLLLSYDGWTNFDGRASELLWLAAPAPLGDVTELAADLFRYTPTGSVITQLRDAGERVVFTPDTVTVSGWAAARIAELKLPTGSYGVDVTGHQTITMTGSPTPITVTTQVGLTIACPPATDRCSIDRIYPGPLQQELGG